METFSLHLHSAFTPFVVGLSLMSHCGVTPLCVKKRNNMSIIVLWNLAAVNVPISLPVLRVLLLGVIRKAESRNVWVYVHVCIYVCIWVYDWTITVFLLLQNDTDTPYLFSFLHTRYNQTNVLKCWMWTINTYIPTPPLPRGTWKACGLILYWLVTHHSQHIMQLPALSQTHGTNRWANAKWPTESRLNHCKMDSRISSECFHRSVLITTLL